MTGNKSYLFLVLIVIISTGNCKHLNLAYDSSTKSFTYSATNTSKPILSGSLGNTLTSDQSSIITETLEADLFQLSFKTDFQATKLTVRRSLANNNVKCNNFEWSSSSLSSAQGLVDCFDIQKGSFWYGGAEMSSQQFWPINDQVIDSFQPYVTGVYSSASSVLERYWLSSAGVAIVVDPKTPLFVSKNLTHLCFKSNSTEWPYSEHFPSSFKYSVCDIEKDSSPSDYLNQLHLFVINNFFAKPRGK